jgi:glutamate dehydrogenase
MAHTPKDKNADLLEKILAMIDDKFPAPESQQIKHFVQHFYHAVAPEDMHGNVTNLYGAAVAYWHLARQYTPDQTKVRVYNPQFEQEGWQSPHTIVSILIKDMPFLIDTIRMALNRQGLTVHLIVYPLIPVHRDEQGQLCQVLPYEPSLSQAKGNYESIIHVEIDKQTETAPIALELKTVLGELRMAVDDWQKMRDKMGEALQELDANSEECEFLRWAQANHFTFLGYREYHLSDQHQLRRVLGTGLGILRDKEGLAEISPSFAQLPSRLRELAHKSPFLLLNKTKARSNIHRPAHLDYIGIKRINKEGNVIGERRFLGLYTSAAYHQLTAEIPLIRRKIKYVFEKAGFRHRSHKHQALFYLLETYPRDELFQIDQETLRQTAMGILQLQERQQPIRLFVRADTYGRFFSCLVYVPRDRYDTEIRQRMESVLLEAFGGTHIEFNVWLSESVLAQIHFIVYTPTGTCVNCDFKDIENQLVEVTREWQDVLHDALLEHNGEEHGTHLFRRYEKAFPVAYRADFSAPYAVYDIEQIEKVIENDHLGMSLYRPIEALDNSLSFKLFHAKSHIPLSQILPMLENMGVKVISERSYEVSPIWIQEFGLLHHEKSLDISQIKDVFQDVFVRLWQGDIENDGFNRLALAAQLTWREILIFRAYWKYLRQTGANFSQKYVEQALLNNPTIAKSLLDLFYARCKPRATQNNSLVQEIEKSLDSVTSLDEDRILRLFLGVILATLRTNYFQDKAYLSFKFDPSKVPDLPSPRPMFEIFVYSPHVEGVHLRGGKVARGGLRCSDRLEDFRTEILGLVKAQMVKNAVIVPVGSKGGFVAKQGGQGIECYKTFIRGLLDLTDNLVEGKIVPPPKVVRHDDDDPYLVVAADKGTATFSDIANEIAKEYNFWLSDAFASGGSSGYDHKKMGITARGAWESVKRHFREVDIQTQDFTVIGIGDMSGDVFGNGMLLSKHIKLLGAFNHLHIFLDPKPNPEKSWQERQRLFNLPHSTWADYDPNLISEGGGVFSRSRKFIVLSSQVQAILGIQAKTLTPNDLIRAMLCAPVDLLWNGGIGTYVKAQTEHHADVGDKTNDALRVNGQDLRCKVVGEGGNLGFTQLGRIEYAQNGGCINTDALDNSGGVDCSDHEVNIKILLNAIVANGDMTNKQRNQMLADMTDAVSKLVIKNNYLQAQAISIPLSISPQMFDLHVRFIRHLEKQGQLDRELEFLPNNKMLAERRTAQQGLTSPELCVLLAYSKITLYRALLESDLPEEPYFRQILENYFPAPLPERFAEQIAQHRLHREIIATQLTNLVINRGGIAFVYMLEEETGKTAAEIVRAFMVAWEIFDIERLCSDIEALQIDAQVQLKMIMSARQQIERASRWLLRHHRMPIAKTIEALRPGVTQLADSLEHSEKEAQELIEAGVPDALAIRVARLEIWLSALDIVEVANTGVTLEHVAAVHFQLGSRLKLHWLRDQISQLPRDNRWSALSRLALRDELYRTHRELTTVVLQTNSKTPDAQIEAWMTKNGTRIERCQQVLSEISHVETPYLAMLSVGLREIRNLL